MKINTTRPLVHVTINNHKGCAFIDTGAKLSIAGSTLTNLLLTDKTPYTEDNCRMILADGVERFVRVYVFHICVTLQKKTVSLQIFAIPEHTNSRTLLGVDFVRAANIILNLPNNTYFFADAVRSDEYTFVAEDDVLSTCGLNSIYLEKILLREDEGQYLSADEREELNKTLSDAAEIFSRSGEATPFAEHCIVLTDDKPIAMPPYRLSEIKKKQLLEELTKLLEGGVIEECESPYAAPVVLVPKKNGEIRLTVDYRGINAITRADTYPLPRMDDLLHEAKSTKYMSTLDLKSGYHQVNVRPSDRDKTAFVTPFGTYRFIRMPFGLRNAPSTFQRLMNRFKTSLPDVFLLVYLDDLIVISASFNEHVNDLKKIFDKLNHYKLRLNRDKCVFACQSVRYLGHIISPEGLKPDPDKVNAILSMKPPTNVKQLMGFFQTCSWFRRFIPDFAAISQPLSLLTRKNVAWKWNPEQEEAFIQLKTKLSTAPILRQADPGLPYLLRTDASGYALGACLLQGEGPDERPVEYASRLLIPSEQNYPTTEREALAVVWAVKKFRGYLEGATTIVQSDHQPLKWLMSLKSPSGRLARWSLLLQNYDLRIEYISGKRNVVADLLSRPNLEEMQLATIEVNLPTQSAKNIREDQLKDPEIEKIITCLENPSDETDFKKWSERGFLLNRGVLYKFTPEINEEEPQLVAPKNSIPQILHDYHDSDISGHYGIEKTFQRISSRYYWTGMRRTITEHVQKCLECQRFKSSNLKPAGLLQTPAPTQRFEVISIDLVGPLPEAETGERWILTVEDNASRWIEMFPLKDAKAETCARYLVDQIILRYGVPRRVISDNGSQFVGSVMQQTAHILGFRQTLIPVYHPESNPVERRHRDLKTQLAILTNDDHTNWKDKLPAVRFAMNTANSESTGYTPAYLTFGRELRTPDDVGRDLRAIMENENFTTDVTPYLKTMVDVLFEARENQIRAQDYRNITTNQKRRPVTYSLGDTVLVKTHTLSNAKDHITSKFLPKRDGPYKIMQKVTPTTYVISSPSDPNVPLGKYHVSALTPYVGQATSNPIRPLRKKGRPRARRVCNDEVDTDDLLEEEEIPEDEIASALPPEPVNETEETFSETETSPEDSIEIGNHSAEDITMRRRRIRKPICTCCPP